MDLPDASSLPDLGPNWTLLKHSGVEESSEDWCLPLPPPPPGLGGGPVLKPEQVCGGAQLAESQAADRRTPTSTPGCVCGGVGMWEAGVIYFGGIPGVEGWRVQAQVWEQQATTRAAPL